MRMQDEGVTKIALTGYIVRRRRRLEGPEGDGYIRLTGKLRGLRRSTEDRDTWWQRIEDAKAQVGL